MKLKFIDLFAGMGGIRKGFELACENRNIESECVFTSEIKTHAIDILKQNYPESTINGDITKVNTKDIPDFDILLGGFPCQAFSMAGKRLGFEDTRGTLFFEVARIIKDKQPKGFILENVEGLVNHDKVYSTDKIGRTLQIILDILAQLGYNISWRVLNATDFGVPQERKRIYIVGTKDAAPNLDNFVKQTKVLKDILETGLPTSDSNFVKLLLKHYTINELIGKSIKDKRGGTDNIHSWDLEYRGAITAAQKQLMSQIMTERRKKKWAAEYGIAWMDGMPLTYAQIQTFNNNSNLQQMLDDLVLKGYLKKEYPKKRVGSERIQDNTLPLGYNIVAGKLSFEVSKILDPNGIAPTLVATDMKQLYVADNGGLRQLTLREGLRLCGYPDNYKFNVSYKNGCDLLGNTVVVTVIQAVAERLLDTLVVNKV